MSEKYEPTPHLRFLKRKIEATKLTPERTERILQQWWVSTWSLSQQHVDWKEFGYANALDLKGEWRDVPCVETYFE